MICVILHFIEYPINIIIISSIWIMLMNETLCYVPELQAVGDLFLKKVSSLDNFLQFDLSLSCLH